MLETQKAQVTAQLIGPAGMRTHSISSVPVSEVAASGRGLVVSKHMHCVLTQQRV